MLTCISPWLNPLRGGGGGVTCDAPLHGDNNYDKLSSIEMFIYVNYILNYEL